MSTQPVIEFDSVSRWYGDVLGINRVTTAIGRGITGLLGANGSGKSTLMNLACGLLRPSQGRVRVFGEPSWNNPGIHRRLGFCPQHDSFYELMTGFEFVYALLALRGYDRPTTRRLAEEALERVDLADAMNKRIASYSKGMRQRVKVALALADVPDVLVLDEPLNGLDARSRHDTIQLIQNYGREGRCVLISSHILHEIESLTDNILMLSQGYLLAEGDVREVRGLLRRIPHTVYLRCSAPRRLAALMFDLPGLVGVSLTPEEDAVAVKTYDLDAFYMRLNDVVLEHGIEVNYTSVADESIQAVFEYLSGGNHE
ncbi:MAG: ABC transporter ATP-binding protein [Candidatus Sumerlaeia bacterium]